jgi:small ligand-binding sensory domain FIST
LSASFRSVKQLVAAMDAFIKAYNQNATPFQWTKVRVSQKSFASKYSDLINQVLSQLVQNSLFASTPLFREAIITKIK